MIANTHNNQPLVDHLYGTMLMSMRAARHLGLNEELVNIAGLSGFLHDIGKCTNYFQEITLKKETFSSEKLFFRKIKNVYPYFSGKVGQDYYPRHNEISWLYSVFFAKAKKNLFKVIAPQAIYWHHGTYLRSNQILDEKSPRGTNEIISELSKYNQDELNVIFNKINSIIESVTFPFDISLFLEKDIDDSNINIPRMYDNEKQDGDPTNAQRLVIRSCVIFADHLVSKLSIDELKDLNSGNVDNYFKINDSVIDFNFECPEGFDKSRFDLQNDIINKCEKTTLVKATAGFGKSLIGVMWGLKQKGQVYWVCPRNTVAEGVYENILEEVKRFNLPISVELFLTSERKRCTHDNEICSSDIVVTNIDNLLSPMVAHRQTNRLFDINIGNIVFDEFHEFINDEALFGAFVTYMRARNILCSNVKTLLLSATPSLIHELWDSNSCKTTILPNSNNHYPAQHKQKYNFIFEDEFVKKHVNKSLTMYSSIKNVQSNFKYNYKIIIHSRYSDGDRKSIMDKIFFHFRKNGDKNSNVISAPILQAALNISFETLYKSIESPESDLQTFGRVNRWGELKKVSDIHMINLFHDASEANSIRTRYNWDLAKKWYNFINENFNKQLTLDEIYYFYNRFNYSNILSIKKFLFDKNRDSIEKLKAFFPRQTNHVGEKSAKLISKKTLRNSSPTKFIVVKDDKGNWCDFVFSMEKYDFDEILRNVIDSQHLQSETIKTVWDNLEKIQVDGENIFDYSEMKSIYFPANNKKKPKSRYAADFIEFAKSSETPLPVWSKCYDSKLGLIRWQDR